MLSSLRALSWQVTAVLGLALLGHCPATGRHG